MYENSLSGFSDWVLGTLGKLDCTVKRIDSKSYVLFALDDTSKLRSMVGTYNEKDQTFTEVKNLSKDQIELYNRQLRNYSEEKNLPYETQTIS